jgi:hypothetical protein
VLEPIGNRVSARCVAVIGIVLLGCSIAGCGRAGATVAGRAAVAVRTRAMGAVTRDAVRDRATRVVKLGTERRVFRYTTSEPAARARSAGFPAGTHFTSAVTRGRPLSGAKAADRYGLPHVPDHRLTVTLPKGTQVRFNKALAGNRGVGEITTARPLGGEVIRRDVRISSLRPD